MTSAYDDIVGDSIKISEEDAEKLKKLVLIILGLIVVIVILFAMYQVYNEPNPVPEPNFENPSSFCPAANITVGNVTQCNDVIINGTAMMYCPGYGLFEIPRDNVSVNK